MKSIKIISLLLLLIAIFLASYTWLHWLEPGDYYRVAENAKPVLPHRLRTSAEHDEARTRNGGNPYILEIDLGSSGALLYYGASHIQDPSHPQVADITARWQAFKPTVALHESRRGHFYGALIEPFAGLPEPALLKKLAHSDAVPVFTLEPTYEDEVSLLLQAFSAEQVALYFFLRVYSAETGRSSDERLAEDLLAKRTDVEGLRNSITDLEALDQVWQRDFPDQDDWRVQVLMPGYLSEIDRQSRVGRGEHMLHILIDLLPFWQSCIFPAHNADFPFFLS